MWDHVVIVAMAAVALMLIGFSQTAGDARAFAVKHHYQIDINQESVAQALANTGAGLSKECPYRPAFQRAHSTTTPVQRRDWRP
jgi:sulfate permease, SulP family